MGEIGIRDIKSYIPEKRLTNDELVKRLKVDKNFLEEKLGIINRSISDNNEASSDLAIRAAEKLLLMNSSLKKEDIDLLIIVTQTPDYKLPHTSAIVQDRLGLSNIAAFDLNLGCSGFVYSLAVAKSMMETLGFKSTIIITADVYSKIISPLDRDTVTLFGDAASAIWLNEDSSNLLLNFTFGTDGSGYDSLIVEGGGSKFPINSTKNTPISKEYSGTSSPHNVYMDGRKIYNFMMKRIPVDVNRCLNINNLAIDEIDYFVFHQASKFMVESLAYRLEIPNEKVIFFLKDTGNTVSSSIPIALENLINSHNMSNKKVLISGFGVGLSWATNIISFK